MDATQTRTVAEVMGFTPRHDFIDGRCSWCDDFENRPVVATYCPDNLSGPTVDDMLAWLTGASDRNVKVEERRQSKWGGSRLVIVTVHRGAFGEHYRAPTLHAALTQAVLAVGGP